MKLKNVTNKTKKMIENTKKITFGHIEMDKNLKVGLIAIIVLLIVGLLIRNIISEFIEKLFIFLIIFSLIFLVTHNWMISIVVGAIFYMIVLSMKNALSSREKFENQGSDDTTKDDKKFLDKLSKNETTNKNIEETPITKQETSDMDLNKAAMDMAKLADTLQGGIKLKDDDTKETSALNVDFRNTPYKEGKMSPKEQAQKEAYELIDSISNLENTLKTLNPVLNESKKILNMYEQFKL